MNSSHLRRRSVVTIAFCLAATAAFAQDLLNTFEPEVGRPGKDVIWVPTADELVTKMLDMADVTPNDFVIDLGSGDGRTVIAAANRGARALGIEYDPEMVALSKENAAKAGVTDKASFVKADLFETDFSHATVLTMFLLPSINLKLRPTILAMRPGTRVVSNTFTMDTWEPDATATIDTNCRSWCKALFWVVPAKVEGNWRLPQGRLMLKQEFQKISGTLDSGGKTVEVGGRLRGDQITFSAGTAQYTGRVNGNAMEGTLAGANGGSWTAAREDR